MDEKPPVNKIPNEFYIAKEKQHRYQISVTDIETGECIYLNQSFAGIMCTAEKIMDFGLEVETNHQHMEWGNLLVQMHLYNMLTDNIKLKTPQVINEIERLGFMPPDQIKVLRMRYTQQFGDQPNGKE